MPIYTDVKPITYYPGPERVAREIFKDLELTSILDVGAGHGGVFDLERWDTDPKVIRKEACDLFWIRAMPAGWHGVKGLDSKRLPYTRGLARGSSSCDRR